MLLLAGVAEINALALRTLRRITQWPWIENPIAQLIDGHATTSYRRQNVLSCSMTSDCQLVAERSYLQW